MPGRVLARVNVRVGRRESFPPVPKLYLLLIVPGIDKSNLYQYMVYYSIVTLSTLGYGEIVPVNQVARNWAAMEAMIGQFYIAIVIARLVSMYTVEETKEQD